MEKNNVVMMLYILISLTVIVVLFCLLMKKNRDKKDNFCLCQGMRHKVCPNRNLLRDLYASGKLTEFTDLTKGHEPKWHNGNFGETY